MGAEILVPKGYASLSTMLSALSSHREWKSFGRKKAASAKTKAAFFIT